MSKFERLLLGIILLEIPLQVGMHFFYQEREASFGAVGGVQLSLTTFCLIGLYGAWLLEAARPQHARQPLALSVPLLFYVGIAVFSLVLAESGLLAVSYVVLLLQAFALFLYVANRLRGKDDLVFVLSVLAVALVIQSAIVIGSWSLRPLLAGREIGVRPFSISVWPDGRPCGTFTTPVSAGSYLALLLAPVASLLLMPVSRRVKLLALLAVTGGAIAIPLTQSRAAILAAGTAVIVFSLAAWVRGRVPRWAVAMALLLAVAAAFPAARVFQQRTVVSDQGSAASRLHQAQIAWNLIQDRPFAGVGANNYYVAARPYANASPFRSEWDYVVHCNYLLVWAETGILGLAAFLAFLLSIVYYGWRLWGGRDPMTAPLALAIAATVLGQMGHMLVDLFNGRSHIETLWCLAGMMIAMLWFAGAASTGPMRDARPQLYPSPHGAWRRRRYSPPRPRPRARATAGSNRHG